MIPGIWEQTNGEAGLSQLEALRSSYPGDEAWAVFAQAWKSNDVEISSVARMMWGDEADDWFATSVPALDGNCPAEILESHPYGQTIIRSILMRMP